MLEGDEVVNAFLEIGQNIKPDELESVMEEFGCVAGKMTRSQFEEVLRQRIADSDIVSPAAATALFAEFQEGGKISEKELMDALEALAQAGMDTGRIRRIVGRVHMDNDGYIDLSKLESFVKKHVYSG